MLRAPRNRPDWTPPPPPEITDWAERFTDVVGSIRLLVAQMERQMQMGEPCGACHGHWYSAQGKGHFPSCAFALLRDWLREADSA